MSKKYISLFLSLALTIISFNIVWGATIEMSLNTAANSYELQTKDKLGKYFSSKDTKWQGACIADKYIVICAINSKDNGNIYVFDKNSTNIAPKCKVAISGHHCNSITYDSKRSLLIVSAKLKPPMLFELNKSTGEIIKKEFVFTQTEKLSDGTIVNPTTIAYNADKDNFVVLYSYASKYYIYSSTDFYNNNKSTNVKEYSCQKYKSNYYCQQATVYNSFLFYTVNHKKDGKLYTYVYVYDLLDNGTLVDTITEKKSTLEVEGATFDSDNDSMYIFYHLHDGTKYRKFALYRTNISGSRYTRFIAIFNGNGGTNGSSIVKYGSKSLGNLPTSKRKGYLFDGWYTEINGGTKIDSNTILSKNTTFYAHWTPVKYKIVYDLAGGSASNPETYDIENDNIILKKPTKTGYTFLGWTGSNGSKAQVNVTISKGSTGDRNYKANWKQNAVVSGTETTGGGNNGSTTGSGTGTTGGNTTTTGGGTGTTAGNTTTTGGSTGTTAGNTTTTGGSTGTTAGNSTTTGGSTGTTTGNTTTGSNSGTTIGGGTGKLENEIVKVYQIKVVKSTGGKIKPSTQNVEEGENQTFKIVPDKGYVIDDVIVDGKSVGNIEKYIFRNVDEKHTITAIFAEKAEVLAKSFTDVKPTDWHYDAVKYVLGNELFNGISEKEFAPNAKMTRGMIVTVLYRLSESKSTEKSTFDDVPQNSYYSNAIAWAYKAGIVNGKGDNNFAPEEAISREDLATIMYRYIKKNKIKINVDKNTNVEYLDNEHISDYASESVEQLKSYGLMTGKTENCFEPKGLTTRAEVATILMRLENKKK